MLDTPAPVLPHLLPRNIMKAETVITFISILLLFEWKRPTAHFGTQHTHTQSHAHTHTHTHPHTPTHTHTPPPPPPPRTHTVTCTHTRTHTVTCLIYGK